MKVIFPIVAILILAGCAHDCPTHKCPKSSHSKTTCPKFMAKLSIDVKELNSTYAAISWRDVSKIERFLKEKKRFNGRVTALNK